MKKVLKLLVLVCCWYPQVVQVAPVEGPEVDLFKEPKNETERKNLIGRYEERNKLSKENLNALKNRVHNALVQDYKDGDKATRDEHRTWGHVFFGKDGTWRMRWRERDAANQAHEEIKQAHKEIKQEQERIREMLPRDMTQEFIENLEPYQIEVLDPSQILSLCTIPKKGFRGIGPLRILDITTKIQYFSPDQIKLFDTKQVQALKLKSLTPDQIKALEPNQIKVLTAEQIKSLDVGFLSEAQKKSLTQEQIRALDPNQLREIRDLKSFTPEQISWFTLEQINSWTENQILLLARGNKFNTEFFKKLSDDQLQAIIKRIRTLVSTPAHSIKPDSLSMIQTEIRNLLDMRRDELAELFQG